MKTRNTLILIGIIFCFTIAFYFNNYLNEDSSVRECKENINSLIFQKQFGGYEDWSEGEKTAFKLNAYSVIKRCDTILQ